MANKISIRQGMQVYDSINQSYGVVERVAGNQFYIQRKAFALSAISRVEGNKAYLANTGDAVIPIVEEELQAGKRQVQGGGVRVTTEVTERPLEAQVNLREETIEVKHRPANRIASDAELAAMKKVVIEITTPKDRAKS